jgi:PAS domain S-box-containing protein
MHNKRSNDKRLSVLDAAMNAASDALIVINCEGRVVEWSSRAATFFGWSREEAIDQYLHLMIVPKRLQDRHQQGLKQFPDQHSGKLIGQRMRLQAIAASGHASRRRGDSDRTDSQPLRIER